MPDTRVTIAEVARAAGVSKATVSLVLNGRTTSVAISEATQASVREVAQRLGYTPNQAARALRSRRSHVIAMLIANLVNPFYLDIATAATAAATTRDYQLTLIDGSHPQAKLDALARLRSGGADGLIIATGYHSTHGQELDIVHDLVSRAMPVVMVLDTSPNPSVPAIRIDNAQAAYQGAHHLVRLGHHRLAYLALGGTHPSADPASTQAQRYLGYELALAEAGVTPKPEWLLQTWSLSMAGGYDLMRRLLQSPEPHPTAALVYNDQMAMGALRACYELGVRVPDDMAIVGFGGIEAGQFTTPALTTVDYPRREMGEAAVSTLLSLLDGAPVEPIERVLPVQLTVRESCGARLPA